MSKLPLIFEVADEKAGKAQNNHFRSLFFQYVILVSASISTLSVGYLGAQFATASYIFLITLSLLILHRTSRSRYTSSWYRLRAIAESIKTVSWKLTMSCTDQNGQPANEALKEAAAKILHSHSQVPEISELKGIEVSETPWMVRVRNLAVEDRFKTYERERIREQLSWYESRSNSMKIMSSMFTVSSPT